MARYYLSALGADRPGIVAALTEVLTREGCNLEDSAMTILRGQFVVMVLVDAPGRDDPRDLERALAGVARDLELSVEVRAVHEGAAARPGSAWSVSVHGADRPGIVSRVTSLLASAGANVVDLTTRVVGEPTRPGYVMVIAVTLPEGTDTAGLGRDLTGLGMELGVHCALHEAEADIL